MCQIGAPNRSYLSPMPNFNAAKYSWFTVCGLSRYKKVVFLPEIPFGPKRLNRSNHARIICNVTLRWTKSLILLWWSANINVMSEDATTYSVEIWSHCQFKNSQKRQSCVTFFTMYVNWRKNTVTCYNVKCSVPSQSFIGNYLKLKMVFLFVAVVLLSW